MTSKFSISAAIGAASIIGMLAFGATSAVAKSVTSCHAANGASVVSCCEKIVAQKGMPSWMVQGSLTCREVVRCALLTKSNNRCSVQPRLVEKETRGKHNEGQGRGSAV